MLKRFVQIMLFLQKSINRNIQLGSPIIQVSATDADSNMNGEVAYSLDDGFGAFEIGQTNGIISNVLSPLTRTLYRIIVRATDKGSPPLSSTVTVEISVTEIQFEKPLYRFTVLENQPINTLVGRVASSQAERGKVRYSIKDEIPMIMPFGIRPRTGSIRTTQILDREQRENYEFIIMVQEDTNKANTATATVQVTVLDVNDNAPQFQQNEYKVSTLILFRNLVTLLF